MRKQALAALALPLAVACGESPVTPPTAPPAEARAAALPVSLQVLSAEQTGGLAAIIDDARVRVLPGLGHEALDPVLARVGAALAGSDPSELDAAVAAALASVDELASGAEPSAELDLIRLALADVALAAHPAPELAQ